MPIRSSSLRGTTLGIALVAIIQATSIASAEARTLETAFGPVEIDGEPERVVTLYEGALDTALTAGVEPLGAVATRGGQGVADYLGDAAEGIAIVGTARETNLEAVVALRPDLILTSPRLAEAQYSRLSQIAPTVVPAIEGFRPDAWKDEARLFAKALGREAPVDEAIVDVEQRAAQLKERQPESGGEAMLARWMPSGPMVMSSRLFATGLLAASGFDVTDADLVPASRPHSDPLSLENLDRIDRGWLFLATLNEDGEAALDQARLTPAFERLDVVQRDRVVPVDGQLWSSASGPLAAQHILETLSDTLDRQAERQNAVGEP